jgi:transposase
MGRRRIEISREQIEALLDRGKKLSEIAVVLGVSRSTIIARIKEYGIGRGRGKHKRKFRRRPGRQPSIVKKRLVEHAGEVLPGDPSRLGKILGLRSDTVRAYLKRGRSSSERFIREVLTKAPGNVILIDALGRRIPLKAIAKMKIALDEWGRSVKIIAELHTGNKAVFQYRVEKLWNQIDEEIERNGRN